MSDRFNPHRLFVGAFVPNWLMEREEVSHGAKLMYARLSQFAGSGGRCIPKQETLAHCLGVSDRMIRNLIAELEKHRLVEIERRGLRQANQYHFLTHAWMKSKIPDRQDPSGQDRQNVSGQDRQDPSGHIIDKENQCKIPRKTRGLNGVVSAPTAEEFAVYDAYPYKVARPAALRAIRKALKTASYDELLEKTKLFASTRNGDVTFCPNPATWFNEERFNDDPSTWIRKNGTTDKRPTASSGRAAGTSNEGKSGQYAGVGKVVPRV